MKNSIKYLLLAAIALFFFLNISGKKDNGNEQQTQAQSARTMPQIPNGDFEDRPNKAWTIKKYNMGYEPNRNIGNYHEAEEKKYIIGIDSNNTYHGKYCALLMSRTHLALETYLENKFTLVIHPSSLHGYVKSILNDRCDRVAIQIKLFKNSASVDSGLWNDTTSINQWTEISIPITNKATEIDSAVISIYSIFNPQLHYYTKRYKHQNVSNLTAG